MMTEKKMGMSTMSRRIAGPLVAVLLAAGAVTGTGAAQAAGPASGPGWHDGACAANEGQTVVVDHSADMSQKPIIPDNWKAKPGILVRCNVGGQWADSHGDPRVEPLTAVGITFKVDDVSGLVTIVNGTHDVGQKQAYWMYSSANKVNKNWDLWAPPKEGVDTWVGVTLGGNRIPSINPPVKK